MNCAEINCLSNNHTNTAETIQLALNHTNSSKNELISRFHLLHVGFAEKKSNRFYVRSNGVQQNIPWSASSFVKPTRAMKL